MVIILFKLIILMGLLTLILFPFLRKSPQVQLAGDSGDSHPLLLQQKDAIYAAIKELDFDYHMGKLSQEDYQSLRVSYEQQAVELLKRLEDAKPTPAPSPKAGKRS